MIKKVAYAAKGARIQVDSIDDDAQNPHDIRMRRLFQFAASEGGPINTPYTGVPGFVNSSCMLDTYVTIMHGRVVSHRIDYKSIASIDFISGEWHIVAMTTIPQTYMEVLLTRGREYILLDERTNGHSYTTVTYEGVRDTKEAREIASILVEFDDAHHVVFEEPVNGLCRFRLYWI